MFDAWWRRPDVRQVLAAHYSSIGDAHRFVVVGRKEGRLVIADGDIDRLLDSTSPMYVGFSVSGWNSAEEVLDAGPTRSAVEFDLDNFPRALLDLQKLKGWCDARRLSFAVYFTGSKGIRVLVGSTQESYKSVAFWISVLCTVLDVRSLDLFPYSKLEGWLQPASTIHRKSGLPAFPLVDVPASYEALFEQSVAILRGGPISEFKTGDLDGEAFIRQVRAEFDALDEDNRKRVQQGAVALLRTALHGGYEYDGY